MLHLQEKNNEYETNIYSITDKVIFFLYSLYFILTPFYFWKSGLPQIADYILILLIIVVAISNEFRISISKNNKIFLSIGLIFVFYVTIVNFIWVLLLQTSSSFVNSSIYYIYNYLGAVTVVALYGNYKEKILKVTYKAVLISVIIQLVFFFINGGYVGGRSRGSFNNPNQLGYYALLVVGIMMISSNKIEIKYKGFFLGILSTLILVLASLSNAAIISWFILFFLFLVSKTKNKRLKRNVIGVTVIILLSVILVYNFSELFHKSDLFQSVIMRLNTTESKLSQSSDVRGYFRITEFPQFWAFGAGEGAFYRFRGSILEFHSTLGNIQVSYGVVGSLLFICFVIKSLKNDMYRSLYVFASIMAYGLTHNGIRNSMLWILLALIASGERQDYNFKLKKIE